MLGRPAADITTTATAMAPAMSAFALDMIIDITIDTVITGPIGIPLTMAGTTTSIIPVTTSTFTIVGVIGIVGARVIAAIGKAAVQNIVIGVDATRTSVSTRSTGALRD